jgi:hypothetical protein
VSGTIMPKDMEVEHTDGQEAAAVRADASASVDASATVGSTAGSNQNPANQNDAS